MRDLYWKLSGVSKAVSSKFPREDLCKEIKSLMKGKVKSRKSRSKSISSSSKKSIKNRSPKSSKDYIEKRVCVKVNNLRKLGYNSFKEWLSNPSNKYVGRHGRIFIDKKIFPYKGSEFCNPFKVGKDGTLEEVVDKYEKYLDSNKELSSKLFTLKSCNLGCFCDNNQICHVDILLERLKKI